MYGLPSGRYQPCSKAKGQCKDGIPWPMFTDGSLAAKADAPGQVTGPLSQKDWGYVSVCCGGSLLRTVSSCFHPRGPSNSVPWLWARHSRDVPCKECTFPPASTGLLGSPGQTLWLQWTMGAYGVRASLLTSVGQCESLVLQGLSTIMVLPSPALARWCESTKMAPPVPLSLEKVPQTPVPPVDTH